MAKKRQPKKQKERHKLAMTTVEVYRLFKVRDLGRLLYRSGDGIVREIGSSINVETSVMLKKFIHEQNILEKKGIGQGVDPTRDPDDI